MTAGVSVQSSADTATFAAVTGSVDTDYPIGNLSDLTESSKVARITPAGGAIAFTAVLAAATPIRLAALVNHSLPAGSTVRVRFYSDAGLSSLVTGGDLGPTTIPAPVAGYRQVFPALMAAQQSVRSVRVDIASAGSDPVDFGGLEIARFWEWRGISPGAEVGFRSVAKPLDYVGGGSDTSDLDLLRIYNGQLDRLAMAIAASEGLDFQGLKGSARPLVFVEDTADPASWPRTCFLARNLELPAMVGAVYRHDTFQFRLTEWIR